MDWVFLFTCFEDVMAHNYSRWIRLITKLAVSWKFKVQICLKRNKMERNAIYNIKFRSHDKQLREKKCKLGKELFGLISP